MVTFTGLGIGGQFQAPRSARRVFGCWRSWAPESSAALGCESPTQRTGSSWRPGPSAQQAAHSHGQPALRRGPQGREAWTSGRLDPRHGRQRGASPPSGLPAQTAQSAALGGGAGLGPRRSPFPLEGSSFRGLKVKHEAHPGPHSMTRKTLRGGTTCFSEFSSSPLLSSPS